MEENDALNRNSLTARYCYFEPTFELILLKKLLSK